MGQWLVRIKPDTTTAVAEAESTLTTQNERCLATLNELRGALVELTEKLVERETIDGEEVAQAISNARAADKNLEGANREAA